MKDKTMELKIRYQAAGMSEDVEWDGGGASSDSSIGEPRIMDPTNSVACSHERASSLPDNFIAECTTVILLRILPAAAVLVGLPLIIWDAYPQNWGVFNLWPFIRHLDLVWSSLLHFSIWPIIVLTTMVVALLPSDGLSRSFAMSTTSSGNNGARIAKLKSLLVNISQSNWKMSLALSIAFGSAIAINFGLQLGLPSPLWNPFIWGRYQVYSPGNTVSSLQGACLDVVSHSKQPLCLSESKWNELSSGKLSSLKRDDVETVQRGLDYLRNQSGGLIINTLARDVADSIPALKQNMDGLAPFFKDPQNKLSLVIFENDSDDGTRDLFKQWAEEESSYSVDIIGCGPTNPDCKLGELDRYDKMNMFKNPNASGVGKLGEFRQIILEYILKKEEYNDFSHMIVLDVDLGVSVSPLGLLHTLGLENNIAQEYVVASSSSQVWPGSMGTIIPPYDLSAFRPKPTEMNEKVRGLHKSFCHLMPAGDRWRNMCEAVSPMQLFMISQSADATINHEKAHEVGSAFNGITLYPISLIRNRGNAAQYDSGDDNQRCEHVGFHFSLRESMFVNPKWSMNLKASNPGGPTGYRAVTTLSYAIIGRPNVMFAVVVINLLCCLAFVCPLWTIIMSIKSLLVLMTAKKQERVRERGESFECSVIDAREM
mmetsp:Transcript_16476/g.24944  ORF Transcript_16476/g.24944 Transcript_16476/m.24944 type:complete len:654 (+) Transcript_16476:128-2089(+)